MNRPVFVVENNKTQLTPHIIKAISNGRMTWDDLVFNGIVEMIDTYEEENFLICKNIHELGKDGIIYTHCEIHPCLVIGVCSGIIPFANHDPSARITYQASMSKQSLSIPGMNYSYRMDTMNHVLDYPQKTLNQTAQMGIMHYNDMPAGNNVVLAICTYGGFNQEDSIIINKASIERGLFRSTFYRVYKESESRAIGSEERFGIPDERDIDKLDPMGIVQVGVWVEEGDIIVGKVSTSLDAEGNPLKPRCTVIRHGEQGIVDKVMLTNNTDGTKMVKIRIRCQRIVEVGDKLAAPHCIAGETKIPLQGGLSTPISKLSVKGGEKVWAWAEKDQGFVCRPQLGLMPRGKKKTITVWMQDGRTIKCTPDHKFLTVDDNRNYKWIEAQNLITMEQESKSPSNVLAGLEYPEDIVYTENDWVLNTDGYNYSLKNDRTKTLAFVRLLGYIYADGCIGVDKRDNSPRASVSMGTILDCYQILDDIELLSGSRPKIQNYDKSNNKTDEVFNISIPASINRSIASLEDITVGRRMSQERKLPKFITEDNCPLEIVREFLGGLFGGDGHVPPLHKRTKSLQVNIENIKFSKSCKKIHSQSMLNMLNGLKTMLSKFGIHSGNINNHPNPPRGSKMDKLEPSEIPDAYIFEISDVEKFNEIIGFRYCIEKSLKCSVASSYFRMRRLVKEQYNKIVNYTKEFTDTEKTFKNACNKAKGKLYSEQPYINNEYCNTDYKLIDRRIIEDRTELKQMNFKIFPRANKYLEEVGAYDWYDKTKYIVDRFQENIPYFRLKVLGIRESDEIEVFDISVLENESFLANGILIHNSQKGVIGSVLPQEDMPFSCEGITPDIIINPHCQPSRMTTGHLMEIHSGKFSALSGSFQDATIFSKRDFESVCNGLKDLGYERHGYERLYNGITGEQKTALVYQGVCYYQRLKHMIADKIHSRGLKGPVSMLTRQPSDGRLREGGLRIGEMERDAIVSLGTSSLVQERLMNLSDSYYTYVCDDCGLFAMGNQNKRIYICKSCKNDKISVVKLPYATKLLIMEMYSVNVALRLKLENGKVSVM